MTGQMLLDRADAPAWLAAEMPPGYQTRLTEIERLAADLRAMDAVGRVLWETGGPLRGAVAALFGALKCEVDTGQGGSDPIAVRLGDARRLLVVVSTAAGPIRRTNEELAHAFQSVQFAGADDRVLFVAGNDAATRPGDRPDPFLPDALDVLERIGVVATTTATLFRLWRLWLEDQAKGRKALERLHEQDGGLFTVSPR